MYDWKKGVVDSEYPWKIFGSFTHHTIIYIKIIIFLYESFKSEEDLGDYRNALMEKFQLKLTLLLFRSSYNFFFV
jgi:hypothetical protein